VEELLPNENQNILDNNLIWYCVGIINHKRYVHCIRFLNRTPKPGITSYFIQWFNTAPFSHLHLDEIPDYFESTCFWVHSGVALRKNFFLFEDRMSLLRSTFYYDIKKQTFYRMAFLLPYLEIPEEIPTNKIIFTSSLKSYIYVKRVKKTSYNAKERQKSEFCKSLRKFFHSHNCQGYIEKSYPKLFQEVVKIIFQDGDST